MLDNIIFGILRLARSGSQAISNAIEVGGNVITSMANLAVNNESKNDNSEESVELLI